MSRPRFVFAFAVLVALATAFAACGGGGDSSDESPQAIIDGATLDGVESGKIDFSLDVRAGGKEGGDLDVGLSGAFQGAGGDELPQLDVTATASGTMNGEDIDFDGGLVLLPNSAYVDYQGTTYEVDPTTFGYVESAIGRGQQGGGDPLACAKAATGLDPGEYLDGLSSEGGADVGGTETTKVSGDLDVSSVTELRDELAKDRACRAQLGTAGGSLPPAAKILEDEEEVRDSVKEARVDLYVGDDGIVRRVSAQVRIEPPKETGSGPRSMDVGLDLTLTEVNEEQEISAPEGETRPLNDLFLKLGINPIELLGLLQGEAGGGEFGDLLERLGDATSGGSGGGPQGGGGNGGGARQEYLECLGNATSAADLRKCASLQ